jgi:peptide/nickel transport system substrate-binding protein
VARRLILAVALVAALVPVAGAGGAPEQAPKRGGTLVFGLPSPEPACLNVLDDRCHTGTSLASIAGAVLESPFRFGRDLAPQPRLVSSVSFTKRRPFVLTYRIRPEARWSDGVPVTAQDFVFTLQAVRKHATSDTLHDAVRSARAIDPRTLRVVLRPRVAGWRDLFGFVLPAHALRGQDLTRIWSDRIDNPTTGAPIGSGPFVVESWSRGRELVLRRNPRYWGPRTAHLDRIAVRFTTSAQQRAELLRSGEIDIALGFREEEFLTLRREPALRVVARPALGFEHLELRLGPGGHRALRNKLVRRALMYGIDREAVVRHVYGAVAPTHPWLDSAVFLTQSRYYEPSWTQYRRRPAVARQLLGQAGCRRGEDGIYRCDGERLTLRFMTVAGISTRQRTLEIVQRQLRDVGIDVQTVYLPPGPLLGPDGVLERGEFDVMLFSWVYQPGDTTQLKTIFGCGADFNYSGYCQRLVTAGLDEADRILDARQRARVLARVDRQLARDVPMIPLYQFVFVSARSASVRGYVLNPVSALWSAEQWWLAER